MADFSIISDVSNEVLKLLRENICPELIQSPESIALAAPTDKNADFQLGLYAGVSESGYDQTPRQSGPVSAEASESVFRIVHEYQIPDDVQCGK